MAIPGVTLPVAGAKISAGTFGSEVDSAVAFLMDPPRCHAYNSTGQAFANGSTVLCTWDAEVYDWGTTPMHDNVTNPSRITVPETGLYDCAIFIALSSSISYSQLDVNPRINAAGSSSGGSSIRTWACANGTGQVQLAFERRLTAGDYVEVFVTQTSGASRTSQAFSLGQGMQMRWVAS